MPEPDQEEGLTGLWTQPCKMSGVRPPSRPHPLLSAVKSRPEVSEREVFSLLEL